MTKISVVISAHTEKRWNKTCAAIEFARSQTLSPREVILVVDHNPSLLQRARSQFSDVIVLENRNSPGASGAKNTGIEAAQGDIIVFLDDDAVAAPDWLQMLSEGYENPQIIGVGGKLEPIWLHGRPRWFPDEFDWVVGCTYRGLPEETSPIRNLIGANMSFRREALEEIKYYSGIGHTGTRPFGGMDPDICIRITQRWPQKVLLYEPGALVYHHVDEKRTHWDYFCLRCYNEGLSKAVLTRRVGTQTGLSSERKYTLHTLPQGVLRGLTDAVRGDVSGLARAAAIITGLIITTTGYLVGIATQRLTKRNSIPQQQVPYKST